ncbi:MAG: cell division protein FtsA [Ktedonobacterales bacterium]
MTDSRDHLNCLITGLDIGSSLIKVLVAEQSEDGSLRHVASSFAESAGVASGVIVNIGEAARAIEHACYEVEERLGQHLPCVCVNIGGPQVYGVNARGGYSIVPTRREISQQDITRVINATRHNLTLDRRYEVIYEIPRAYLVNDQIGTADPRGVIGDELEVEIHYTVAPAILIQSLLKSLHLAHIMPDQVLPGALISGEALAHTFDAALRHTANEAPSLGVLNIGAETTSVTLYVSGAVWMSQVAPVGGATITQAVARQLHLPYAAAEELKVRYGHCNPERVDEFELIALPASADYNGWMPRRELVSGIQQGVYSLANSLSQLLDEAREAMVKPEVALLTGGCAELAGLEIMLSQLLDIPLRRAHHGGILGLAPLARQPAFSTAAGLVLWKCHSSTEMVGVSQHRQRLSPPDSGWLGSVKRAVLGMLS